MDNLKLQEEVKALKKLGKHLENKLKLFSLELCDLPDDLLSLMDKCVDIQTQSQLHELDLNYLHEFYFTKKYEALENEIIVAQQTAALKEVQDSIEETQEEIVLLEKFESTVNNRLITDAALKRNLIQIEAKAKELLMRQKHLKIPEDFNIEAVIDKIEELEKRK